MPDDAISLRKIPKQVSVFEAEGAFFFGVAEILKDILDTGNKGPKVLILRLRHVLVLDATGIRALHDLHQGCQKKGITLILAGATGQPLSALQKSDFWAKISAANVTKNIDQALERAEQILAS